MNKIIVSQSGNIINCELTEIICINHINPLEIISCFKCDIGTDFSLGIFGTQSEAKEARLSILNFLIDDTQKIYIMNDEIKKEL